MQSSEFRFQHLPSAAELNRISPTDYDSIYSKSQDASPISSQTRKHFPSDPPYEPVQTVPQQWPMDPDNWSGSPLFKIIGFIGHVFLTLSPIIFLMLAFAALSVDGKPLSHKGQVIIEAAKIAPSLFPIIFAAVVGRLMRTYALWRAERGSSLGLLEQLNGSQNLLAAVERAFHLKGLGGIGFAIIVLWGLSPLGGQSSLRVLSVSTSGSSFQSNVSYFNTENYTQSALQGASALGWAWPTIAAIYQACLLAPDSVISSSQDLWGNVKIPLMQSLPSYGFDGSRSSDWISVPESTIYSSLSGIMVSGLNRNNTANFTISPGYVSLTCSAPEQIKSTPQGNHTDDYFRDLRQWTGNLTYHSNTSRLLFGNPNLPHDAETEQWSSFTVDTNWNYTDRAVANQSNINMIYISQSTDGIFSAFKCAVGYTHVEAWVNCDGLDCYVAKIRPSTQSHPPPNITPFNQGFITLYANLISQFPWVTGQQHSAVTSPTDWYVSGSDTPYNPSFGSANYTNVSAQQVSYRLTTLINTFWQTSMTQSSLVQPHLPEHARTSLGYDAIQTPATMQTSTDVYVASKVWVSLTIIISFVMAFCGIAGAVFRYMTTAPDILGYVSSLTKDNPFFQGSAGSDTLDGLERTRLLQNVVIQIGNVRPWDQKAYIALRDIPEGVDKRCSRINPAYPRIKPS